MTIHRTLTVVTLALFALVGLASHAWAGGRPEPPPDYGSGTIAVVIVALVGAIAGVRIMIGLLRR